MNKILLSLTLFTFICFKTYASVMVVDGNYQGKNLYVKNPFAPSGVGFCIYEVSVNGKTTTDEINSSAFEIDLSLFRFKLGAPILVRIKYKNGCKPRVINPEVLKPQSTCKYSSVSVVNGLMKWKTNGETGKLPFVIEQKKWNKWVKVGEIEGLGTPEENNYEFRINPHSGENTFRIKQKGFSGRPNLSHSKTYYNKIASADFMPKKVRDVITFTYATSYEIYDYLGNIVQRGYGDSVDLSDLEKGEFYINYDVKFGEKFFKK